MNIKTKQKLYLALGILGLLCLGSAAGARIFMPGFLNNMQAAAAIGIGAGLFGFGLAKWWVERWNEKNPELMKQNEIEIQDERNQMIRNKAQAVSGEVLRWLVMAGAWVSIFFGAPLWVTLAFVGVFLLKTFLDLALVAYYQRKM